MKVNAKERPTRTGVAVDLSRPDGNRVARERADENRVAAGIAGAGRLTSRGGPSPEQTEGERRR